MLDELGPLFDRIQPRHAGCEAKYLRDEMAIVIGLPWLACGSGQVMAAQLRFLRERGCRPLFIAVPFEACQRAQNEVWTRFNSQKSELQAENVFISTFNRRPTRGGRVGRFLAKRRDLTALHWSIKVSASAPVTEEIERAVSEKKSPSFSPTMCIRWDLPGNYKAELARTRYALNFLL